jgi:hypothetical protein
MSLINDMLSNLEKRRADSSERPELEGFSAVDESGADRRERLRRFQNGVIGVALIAIIGLPLGLLINRLVKLNPPVHSETVISAVLAPPAPATAPATLPSTPTAATACLLEVRPQKEVAIVDDANTPMGMDSVATTEPPPVDTATAEPALPAWATAPVSPADKHPRVTVVVPVTKPQPVPGPPHMTITPYQPNDSDLRLTLARAQLQSGDARKAVATLEQSPPQLAQEPAYYALLAACYQQTAQWKKSAALYEQLTQLRPTQAAWQLGLGIALERLEQPTEAARHYRFAERGQGLDDGARRFASDRAIALAGK